MKGKSILYDQIAQVTKAMASPNRLELLDYLSQGEKSVEILSEQAGISMKLASAHLRELRNARLVEARRIGNTNPLSVPSV